MVIEITKDNRGLLPDEAGLFMVEQILRTPEVVRRVSTCEPQTAGLALFEKIRLTDGREMFALVEYFIRGFMPGFGDTQIIGIMLSDTKMPDEFLDRMNYYRENYKKGTMVWSGEGANKD